MVYEERIAYILEQLGVGRSYQGFQYTVESCMLVLENAERLGAVTKQVYYVVAERHNTTWKCVERDIRTVAGVIWRGEENVLFHEFCGGVRREKPKAGEFIEMMCEFAKQNRAGDCYCPETGRWCEEKACLQRRIAELSRRCTREVAVVMETAGAVEAGVRKKEEKREKSGV